MTDFLYRFIEGWVRVIVSGAAAEGLLTEMAARGAKLWCVRRLDGRRMEFFMGLAAVPLLRESVRRQHLHVQFKERGGGPLWLHRARRRPGILAGVGIGLVAVWLVLARIWIISVPEGTLPPAAHARLEAVAQIQGLRPGIVRSGLNLPQLRQHMLAKLPGFIWVSIQVRGIRVQVTGGLRVPPLAQAAKQKVVSTKSGRITRIEVYMGEAAVKVGDTVHPGQVLIRSVPFDVSDSHAGSVPADASAQGQVWADVPYSSHVFQPFQIKRCRLTGQTWTQFFLVWGKHAPIQMTGFGRPPFAHYRVQRRDLPEHGPSIHWPAFLMELVYNEVQEVPVRLTVRQARYKAQEKAHRMLLRQIGHKQIIGWRKTVEKNRQGLSITLTAIVNQKVSRIVYS
ncbi:MAG: sporulation protein YqfD [Firmicutes bacterium]|nr:sporulation protein YqfD [Bacillota bacterium]